MASELSRFIEDELRNKGYAYDEDDAEADNPHQTLIGALRVEARVKEQETQKKLFNIKRVVCIGGGVALVLIAWALLITSSSQNRTDPEYKDAIVNYQRYAGYDASSDDVPDSDASAAAKDQQAGDSSKAAEAAATAAEPPDREQSSEEEEVADADTAGSAAEGTAEEPVVVKQEQQKEEQQQKEQMDEQPSQAAAGKQAAADSSKQGSSSSNSSSAAAAPPAAAAAAANLNKLAASSNSSSGQSSSNITSAPAAGADKSAAKPGAVAAAPQSSGDARNSTEIAAPVPAASPAAAESGDRAPAAATPGLKDAFLGEDYAAEYAEEPDDEDYEDLDKLAEELEGSWAGERRRRVARRLLLQHGTSYMRVLAVNGNSAADTNTWQEQQQQWGEQLQIPQR